MPRIVSQIVALVFGMLRLSLLISVQSHGAEATRSDFRGYSLGELQERLHQIDAELEQLARPSFLASVGPIGYRARSHDSSDSSDWIQIDWAADQTIDEIILVPAIAHDSALGIIADGFPTEFRIVAGTSGDRKTGVEIARVRQHESETTGPAPLVIPIGGQSAAWIRIEALKLSTRGFDGLYILQFSEIMAFHGEENVALRQSVTTSRAPLPHPSAWNEDFVVDGILPYVMDAAHGRQSPAYLGYSDPDSKPTFLLDLGEPHPISRIQLHAIETSDTIPKSVEVDYGIPRRLLVEGAMLADFSDAVPLVEVIHESVYDYGPIMVRQFTPKICRFVRLTAHELPIVGMRENGETRVGFSEIEIFANNTNVALHRRMETRGIQNSGRTPVALTDGRNQFGEILPVREWLRQLERRQELEGLRPLVVAEQYHRYDRIKRTFTWLGWLAAVLATATLMLIFNNRVARQRAVFRTRQQIAADLHDELGADIHAIGLLGDLAMRAINSPEKLHTHLRRIRALTDRTAAAARHCTNMLEADDLFGDLEEDMHRASRRAMADIDHEIEISGQEILARLQPRKRIDLFLFYKECLTNIVRHSGATKASTRLVADSKQIRLTITDNGQGMNGSPQQRVPASLRRRAQLLGGGVTSEHAPHGGTCVVLNLRLNRRNTV